jgi:hypothetical protein
VSWFTFSAYLAEDIAMKKMFLMLTIMPALAVGFAARAAELPSFELMGYPITQHQVAVMGAAGVQEQSPTPTLVFAGMPASPHQIAVLTPRSSMTAQQKDPKLTTVGFTTR